MNSVADMLRHTHRLGAEVQHVAIDGHVHTRWMSIPHADGQLPYAAVVRYSTVPRLDAWQEDWTSGYTVGAHWRRGRTLRSRYLVPVRSFAELRDLVAEILLDIAPTEQQGDLLAELVGSAP